MKRLGHLAFNIAWCAAELAVAPYDYLTRGRREAERRVEIDRLRRNRDTYLRNPHPFD